MAAKHLCPCKDSANKCLSFASLLQVVHRRGLKLIGADYGGEREEITCLRAAVSGFFSDRSSETFLNGWALLGCWRGDRSWQASETVS